MGHNLSSHVASSFIHSSPHTSQSLAFPSLKHFDVVVSQIIAFVQNALPSNISLPTKNLTLLVFLNVT